MGDLLRRLCGPESIRRLQLLGSGVGEVQDFRFHGPDVRVPDRARAVSETLSAGTMNMLYAILGHDVADSLAQRRVSRPAHVARLLAQIGRESCRERVCRYV